MDSTVVVQILLKHYGKKEQSTTTGEVCSMEKEATVVDSTARKWLQRLNFVYTNIDDKPKLGLLLQYVDQAAPFN